MNVYDFDKTIYDGDSTFNFYKYVLKKQPSLLLGLPVKAFFFTLMLLKLMDKTKCKERFYKFLRHIKDIDSFVDAFWDDQQAFIKQWYKDTQKDDDVIISASPEFLLEPICKRLGIKHLMASRVDKYTGKYTGVNCYGHEKVLRYKKVFGDTQIDNFFSDSYSDDPLARLSKKSFLVLGNELKPW